MVCTGKAGYLLVVASELRAQLALIGLCPWCVAKQRNAIQTALQQAGWNLGIGLVDLRDDLTVRKLEAKVAEFLEDGFVLGAVPAAS